MRSSYWTCSKFADWLRGTMKPGAATSSEWTQWRKDAKKNFPVRYWLAEEGLDYIQNFVNYIPDKIYAVKYYINNRWISRTHQLTAHRHYLEPGTWHDLGYRFLPCLFSELVDYVEVELAWWHLAWAKPEERAKYNAPWWRFGWWNVRVWRCRQAGLDCLEWQTKLTNEEWLDEDKKHLAEPTLQAKSAKEILELYYWWTIYRPMRPDSAEVSGWSEHCEARRLAAKEKGEGYFDYLDKEELPEEHERTHQMLDKMNEIDAKYEQEDEEMMIRLIKIRQALWT